MAYGIQRGQAQALIEQEGVSAFFAEASSTPCKLDHRRDLRVPVEEIETP